MRPQIKKPAPKKPAPKKPVAKKPVAKKPVAKKPAVKAEGKKFDSDKPVYAMVPAVVRRCLTPASQECGRSAAKYVALTAHHVESDIVKHVCIATAIDAWYDAKYVEALVWISRYFLIVDGYDMVEVGYPLAGLDRAVKIMEHGALKYGRDNWQAMADFERYESAGDRHLGPYLAGQTLDKDSGLEHLAHWQCNVLFKAWQQLTA